MTTNPLDHPDLYDHIELGGVQSPGVVKLSGHDRKIGWDIKKGSGQSGATTTRSSDDPVEFTASFFLADAEDIAAWPTFLAVVKSTVAGKTPQALEVYHPDLAENGITSVVQATILGTVHDGIAGSRWEIFEASSHMPHAEEPERYMAVLDGFLSEVEKARTDQT